MHASVLSVSAVGFVVKGFLVVLCWRQAFLALLLVEVPGFGVSEYYKYIA